MRFVAFILVAAGLILSAQAQLNTVPPAELEAQLMAGQELAQKLRSAQPAEDSEIKGLLMVKPRSQELFEVPVVCKVRLDGDSWKTIYQTVSTASQPAETLIVVHNTNAPNKYLYARAEKPNSPVPEPKPVAREDALIPLAGSDFTLADLGLEFLHWPVQRQLKGEMRLGQPCYVLESRNPRGTGVVRIKSYIDKESGGLLIADAYDENERKVKEFTLGGSSFKKVDGQWRLEKMEIRDAKKGSRTILKFDLNRS